MGVHLAGGIELPDDLVDAQETGNLVVFAGAGVSNPAPSRLPLFRDLANRIGLRHSRELPRSRSVPLDGVLDTWASEGVAVHTTAREIVNEPASKPCFYHRNLVALFGKKQPLRLVTTNFDTHFLSAAASARPVDVYRAPALPPGNGFSGLVFLHGAADQPAENLVLTRQDFGRAYLTQGWARRFLVGMFADPNARVLFVGYSFNDVIMHYLLRGIPMRAPVFVFARTSDADKWRGLGLVPVEYSGRGHRALREGLADWVKRTRMRTIEHREAINQLLGGGPPFRPSPDASYLERAFRDEANVRFFVNGWKTASDVVGRAAVPAPRSRSLSWLAHLVNDPTFRAFFETGSPLRPTTRAFMSWIVDALLQDPLPVLKLVLAQPHVNEDLWDTLLRNVVSRLSVPVRGVAVALLLQRAPSDPRHTASLLSKLNDDFASFVLLLELLTRPRLRRPRLIEHEGSTRMFLDVELVGEQTGLMRAAGTIESFLPQHADELARLAVFRLEQIHRLLASAQNADSKYDPVSFTRHRIVDAGRAPHDWDALVEIARSALDSLARSAPVVFAWADRLASADAPLLRRLALHVLRRQVDDDPRAVLERLLAWDWWYATAVRAELFAVIKDILPVADAAAKDKILNAVLDSHPEEREVAEYERFNLLVWLTTHDSYPEFNSALSRVQGANPDFKPRPHPDLTWWMEPLRSDDSGPTLEQIDSMALADLLAWADTESSDFDLFEKSERVEMWAAGRPNRALDTLDELAESGAWGSRLWDMVLMGLRKAMSVDAWPRVLKLVSRHPEAANISTGFSWLLHDTERAEDERAKVDLALLGTAKSEALRIVESLSGAEPNRALGLDADWVGAAINHSAGRVAEFTVHVISRRWKAAGKSWTGLPEDEARYLLGLIKGDSVPHMMARVVLVSQIHFFFSADLPWTRAHLLPLLDWERDAEEAARVSQGFLAWGRWTGSTLPDLQPVYRACSEHTASLPERYQERLMEHVAGIVIHSGIDPLDGGWLQAILTSVPERLRTKLAHAMFFALIHESLSDDQRKEYWDVWLGRYLSDRAKGQPCAIDSTEACEIVLWAMASPDLLRGLAALLPRFPTPKVEHGFPPDPWLMRRRGVLESDPPAAAAFLLYYLRAMARMDSHDCQRIREVLRGISGGISGDLGAHLDVELLRLGCQQSD